MEKQRLQEKQYLRKNSSKLSRNDGSVHLCYCVCVLCEGRTACATPFMLGTEHNFRESKSLTLLMWVPAGVVAGVVRHQMLAVGTELKFSRSIEWSRLEILNIYLFCVGMGVCLFAVARMWRSKDTLRISSVLLCRIQGLDSSHQIWQLVYLPVEPFHRPLLYVLWDTNCVFFFAVSIIVWPFCSEYLECSDDKVFLPDCDDSVIE